MNLHDELNIIDSLDFLDDDIKSDIKAEMRERWTEINKKGLIKKEINPRLSFFTSFPLLFNNNDRDIIGKIQLTEQCITLFNKGMIFQIAPVRKATKEDRFKLLALSLILPEAKKKINKEWKKVAKSRDKAMENLFKPDPMKLLSNRRFCQACRKEYPLGEIGEYFIPNPILLCNKCHSSISKAYERLKDRFGKKLRADEIPDALEKFIVNLKGIDNENT
jgi:hypothetical protein